MLTNTCAIPINWKLTGVSELPEEFTVTKVSAKQAPAKKETRRGKNGDTMGGKKNTEALEIQRTNSMTSEQKSLKELLARTSGRLEPCKSETIEVSFNSIKE